MKSLNVSIFTNGIMITMSLNHTMSVIYDSSLPLIPSSTVTTYCHSLSPFHFSSTATKLRHLVSDHGNSSLPPYSPVTMLINSLEEHLYK